MPLKMRFIEAGEGEDLSISDFKGLYLLVSGSRRVRTVIGSQLGNLG